MKKIYVTNYEKKIFKQPIENIFNNPIIEQRDANEICLNHSLFIHVFNTIPFVRSIPTNKTWFKRNIYHFE